MLPASFNKVLAYRPELSLRTSEFSLPLFTPTASRVVYHLHLPNSSPQSTFSINPRHHASTSQHESWARLQEVCATSDLECVKYDGVQERGPQHTTCQPLQEVNNLPPPVRTAGKATSNGLNDDQENELLRWIRQVKELYALPTKTQIVRSANQTHKRDRNNTALKQSWISQFHSAPTR